MSENIDTNSWDNILHDDEKIHWQGSPVPELNLRVWDYFIILFGLIFAGGAINVIIDMISDGGFGWTFGLPHFFFGIAIILVPLVWKPMVQRRTFYTLTNKRVFIAQDIPFRGRELKSWPLDQLSNVDLLDGQLGSIYFTQEYLKTNDSFNTSRAGFERIENAREVFSKISQLRQDLIQSTQTVKQDA